jgi:hypothetical protein
MKTKNDYPQFYSQIKHYLPMLEDSWYTVGNVIYNPKNYYLTPDAIRHEMKHSEQQSEYQKGESWIIKLPRTRVKEWWNRFLQDPAFRLSQDLPAYQVQLWELETVLDERKLKEMRRLFAKDLNSPLYHKDGKPLIKIGQAIRALESKRLIHFKV